MCRVCLLKCKRIKLDGVADILLLSSESHVYPQKGFYARVSVAVNVHDEVATHKMYQP